jgi:hypothetical protein
MKKIAYLNIMTRPNWASALHGDQNGKCINIAGPGHSKSDRSLGVWFDPNARDGFRFHSLAGDDPTLCRDHVKLRLKAALEKLGLDLQLIATAFTGCDTADDKSVVENAGAGQAYKTSLASKLWGQRVSIEDTLAAKYLNARQCPVSPEVIAAAALGFHAICPFGHERFPALLALVTNPVTGEPLGIHRTAVRSDGLGKQKMPDGGAPKRMLGSSKGGVVRLQPGGPSLGIAEGIETALSAAEIFKMPVWAALSANGIANFPIVPGVERLTVFADHDTAGISAARKCRHKYKKAGIGVEVRYPPLIGNDWNDHARKDASHGYCYKEEGDV